MTVSCSQFRSRDINKGEFNIYTCNDPIIESSADLVFGPFNMKYPQLHSQVLAVDTLEGEFKDDDGEVRKRYNHWN